MSLLFIVCKMPYYYFQDMNPLKNEVQLVRSDFADMKKEIMSFNQDIDPLKDTIRSAREEFMNIKKEISFISKNVNTLKDEVQSTRESFVLIKDELRYNFQNIDENFTGVKKGISHTKDNLKINNENSKTYTVISVIIFLMNFVKVNSNIKLCITTLLPFLIPFVSFKINIGIIVILCITATLYKTN